MSKSHNMTARSADGTRISFDVTGRGAPVLLLHGFSDSRRSWHAAGYSDGLADRGFTVIAVDARGHGHSDRPTDPTAYSGEKLLADLSAVLNTLGIERTALLGFSMGGVAALAGAAFLGPRVCGAIAIGAHPFAEDLSWLRSLLANGLDSWINEVDRTIGGLDAETRGRLEANDFEALRAIVCKDREDFSAVLDASGRPVQAFLGTRDPRYGFREKLRRVQSVQTIALEDADHFSSLLAARAFLPQMAEFMARSAREFA